MSMLTSFKMEKPLNKTELRSIKPSKHEFTKLSRNPIYIALDSLKCAHNIGTILRLSDALLVNRVYIFGNTIVPPNRKIKVSSRGSERWVSWEYRENIVDLIKELKNNELPGKPEFERNLKLLSIYLASNVKDVKPEQIRDAVDEVLEGGGEMMSTVFQQLIQRGKEIGVKEGEEIGVKKGEEKKSLRVALNCLIKGMDIETIAELTDLPIERIKALKTAAQQENVGHN
jgi:hypothetical protein